MHRISNINNMCTYTIIQRHIVLFIWIVFVRLYVMCTVHLYCTICIRDKCKCLWMCIRVRWRIKIGVQDNFECQFFLLFQMDWLWLIHADFYKCHLCSWPYICWMHAIWWHIYAKQKHIKLKPIKYR